MVNRWRPSLKDGQKWGVYTHELVMINGSKKKIKAAWGDDDECYSDEESNNNEVANLCLMAFGDDDEGNNESYSFDEL